MYKWLIVEDVPGREIGYRAIIDNEGFTVCDPSPMGRDNANLIASAPDLYDALVALSNLQIKGHSLIHRLQFSDEGRELSEKINSAIRRARGFK